MGFISARTNTILNVFVSVGPSSFLWAFIPPSFVSFWRGKKLAEQKGLKRKREKRFQEGKKG